MKAREVILLLLIIGAGALIHEIQNGNLPFFWDFEEGIFWNAQEFDFEETLTVDPPLPGQLVVDNAHGQVDVQAGPADRITITLTKRIYRKTEAEARADLATLQKMVATKTRTGKISASDWLGYEGDLAALKAQEAIADRLVREFGYDIYLNEIVSFQRVTRESLAL